jgi:small-conductance mechanosensitive channel
MSNVDVNAPACASEAGSFCQWFWENTGLGFVARNADGALDALVHITLIVLISFGVRALVFRAVNRLTKLTAVGATPAILRPLRAQARRALNRAVSAERRQQRALAVGSLLKSVTSFLIFGTAVILGHPHPGRTRDQRRAPAGIAGIAGVALAFGAQNLIKDFLAGIFMTLEDQYGVGDAVDLGSASGTVTTVGLRTTTIRAGDGTIWYVRNGEVMRVGNSSQGEAVVAIDLPLPYDADTARAGEIALAQTRMVSSSAEFADLIDEEPQLLGIVDIEPGIVTIRLTATVRSGDQDAYLRAVRAAIKTAFDAARVKDPAVDFRPPAAPAVGDAI